MGKCPLGVCLLEFVDEVIIFVTGSLISKSVPFKLLDSVLFFDASELEIPKLSQNFLKIK